MFTLRKKGSTKHPKRGWNSILNDMGWQPLKQNWYINNTLNFKVALDGIKESHYSSFSFLYILCTIKNSTCMWFTWIWKMQFWKMHICLMKIKIEGNLPHLWWSSHCHHCSQTPPWLSLGHPLSSPQNPIYRIILISLVTKA